ncbi:nucleotidyltransferase domain-containing protein [Streptomyces leeuwenhoekii]|uniref:nucleotidyltransferase domain-containing protein n=1 Tax=Streptomyces leeuwenhoekii TaxID=1437453 RepID=UPI00099DC298|nr:nucleotidyltransferase [Streptomyces leeuwenhoekii]
MAWTVDSAFSEFHQNINLPGDHRTTANTRKDWVLRQLGTSFTVLDAFTMGSIPRFTALKGYADLDIMAVLHYEKHIKGRLPSTVLSNVKRALGPGAGNVRRNGQAVTIKFQSWPNIDVVPAVRHVNDAGQVTHYEIPDMNREVWLETKPRNHASKVSQKSADHGPKFRQVIKFIKDWNRRQSVRLQSYHIEVIALQTSTDWKEYDWSVLQWFSQAKSSIYSCWNDGNDVSQYLTPDRAYKIQQAVNGAHSAALNAWYATAGPAKDQAAAIRGWKSVFGQNFPNYG